MRATVFGAALALGLAFGAGAARADTILSDDFTAGLGPSEYVSGNFGVGNGFVGHQLGLYQTYDNNERSSYGFTLDLSGYSSASVSYGYLVNSEPCCDALTVAVGQAGSSTFTTLHTYYGWNNTGSASVDLTPYIGPQTQVQFNFASDATVAFTVGAEISNLVVSGTKIGGSAGAGTPGPVAGAGLPALLAGAAFLALRRRQAARAA